MAALTVVVVVAAVVVGLLTYAAIAAVQRAAVGRAASGRLRAARGHLVGDLTPFGAYVFLYAVALGVTGAVGWVVGVAARNSQAADWGVFHWFAERQYDGMTTAMNQLTKMGNRLEIKVLIVLAAVVLLALYRKRAWAPILVLVLTFGAEHFLQRMLGLTIHRGHPPTDMGTYPSGGCARLVSTYGMIWYLLAARFRLAPWLWRAGFAVVGALGTVEAFSRVVLQKHWVSDVVGGLLFGLALLMTMVYAGEALGISRDRDRRGAPVDRSRTGAGDRTHAPQAQVPAG